MTLLIVCVLALLSHCSQASNQCSSRPVDSLSIAAAKKVDSFLCTAMTADSALNDSTHSTEKHQAGQSSDHVHSENTQTMQQSDQVMKTQSHYSQASQTSPQTAPALKVKKAIRTKPKSANHKRKADPEAQADRSTQDKQNANSNQNKATDRAEAAVDTQPQPPAQPKAKLVTSINAQGIRVGPNGRPLKKKMQSKPLEVQEDLLVCHSPGALEELQLLSWRSDELPYHAKSKGVTLSKNEDSDELIEESEITQTKVSLPRRMPTPSWSDEDDEMTQHVSPSAQEEQREVRNNRLLDDESLLSSSSSSSESNSSSLSDSGWSTGDAAALSSSAPLARSKSKTQRRLIINSKPTIPLSIRIGPRTGPDIRPFMIVTFLRVTTESMKQKNARTKNRSTSNNNKTSVDVDQPMANSNQDQVMQRQQQQQNGSSSNCSSLGAPSLDKPLNNRMSPLNDRNKKGRLYKLVRRKTLIDTGARRSAITQEVFDMLGLQSESTTSIKVGSGMSEQRHMAPVRVMVKAEDDSLSCVELDVSVRKGMSHCLLGSDWLMAVEPKWTYERQPFTKKKKPAAKKKATQDNSDAAPDAAPSPLEQDATDTKSCPVTGDSDKSDALDSHSSESAQEQAESNPDYREENESNKEDQLMTIETFATSDATSNTLSAAQTDQLKANL